MTECLFLIDRVETANELSPYGRLRGLSLYGIEVWPLIRVRLIDLPTSTTHSFRRVRLGQVFMLLQGGLELAWAMLSKTLDRPVAQQGCVFFSHPECLAQLDDQWHDRFCDPIATVADSLGQQSTVLEYSAFMKWTKPSVRPRLDVTLLLVLAKLFSFPLVLFARCRRTAKVAELGQLLEYCGAQDYVSVVEVISLAAFVACARKFLIIAMWPWRFRLGFVCTYYSSSAMAFIMAARSLGIPVYDIQHGVQSEQHIAYRAWHNFDGRLPGSLPDGFWCWDNTSAAQLQRWCSHYDGPKVVVGGNVWFEYVLTSTHVAVVKPSDGVTVMVSLQPLPDPLPSILLQAMAGSPPEVFWLVRLHPAMSEVLVEKLKAKLIFAGCRNFHIDGNEPLPLQLARTDLHVTAYSSVVIEASSVGVLSVLLDRRGLVIFRHAVVSGQAIYVKSARELLSLVAIANRPNTSYLPDRNIEKALQRILCDSAVSV